MIFLLAQNSRFHSKCRTKDQLERLAKTNGLLGPWESLHSTSQGVLREPCNLWLPLLDLIFIISKESLQSYPASAPCRVLSMPRKTWGGRRHSGFEWTGHVLKNKSKRPQLLDKKRTKDMNVLGSNNHHANSRCFLNWGFNCRIHLAQFLISVPLNCYL